MKPKTGQPYPAGRPILPLALVACALTSCASREGVEGEIPRDPVQVGETMVQTSYDYSRPEGIAPDSKPVWILPVINSGWKPAKVDSRTGDWVGGHYSATVVEDGKWATLEEAELSGKPYILPGETRPIIPTPLRSQGAGKTGEINATTLEQKLAKLDKLERESAGEARRDGDAASRRSLINQSAVPSSPLSGDREEDRSAEDRRQIGGGGGDDLPPMAIPGITGDLGGGDRTKPTVLGDAPNLPPLPDPLPQGGGAIPIPPLPKGASTGVGGVSGGEPASLLSPSPSPRYSPETGEILIGVGKPGSTVTVDTPKGPATISYGQGGEVSVTIKGKTRSIKLQPPQNQVKIKLAQ
jgi:hypothetical protein